MTGWRGEWAVVTGASSGIGRAIAHQLASEGVNLILTARRPIEQQFGDVRVESLQLDLAEPGAPQRIFEFTQVRSIKPALLVNNAGFGAYGEFGQIDLPRQLEMIQLNCSTIVGLTHLFLPAMIERGSGDILIVASTAAFQAVPYQTTYAATKAFDLIFAEGVAAEVKRLGVRVCALCPGQTTTEFHQVSHEPIPKAMSVHSAEEVARIGLDAVRHGKQYVICGFGNRMGMELQRVAPRSVVTAVSERLFRPRP
jgi:short-subunit dehydrogenase